MPSTHRPRPRVTAAKVAERAGTSVATVSLVVNGKSEGRVSTAVAQRVQTAIADLGYVVDHAASSLARGTSDIVMLIAPDLTNPFYGRVITSLKAEFGDDYQLLLSVTDEGKLPSAKDVHRLAALRPAGLLVDAPDDAFLRDIPSASALVLLDAPGREPVASTVNFDLEGGIRELLTHLADRGHRRIGYLDARTETETFIVRRSLVARLAPEYGLELFTVPGAASIIAPEAAAEAFIAAWPQWAKAQITALICATDTHAYGVLEGAKRAGVRIPADLAVTGFDDLPASAIVDPPLTTVRLSGSELGTTAARMLRKLVAEKEHVHLSETLNATLIVRESTPQR